MEELYLIQKCQLADFKAQKLRRIWSGISLIWLKNAIGFGFLIGC